jgi:ABC-type transporter Mla subunit MlaD
MALFEFHIHVDNTETEKKLNKIHSHLDYIIKQNTEIMATIAQLTEKVDALQASLDAEQQEIQDAINALNTTVQELRDQIANNEGGTVEERQALADKLDSIKSDLEGTINTTPQEPTEPEEPA